MPTMLQQNIENKEPNLSWHW